VTHARHPPAASEESQARGHVRLGERPRTGDDVAEEQPAQRLVRAAEQAKEERQQFGRLHLRPARMPPESPGLAGAQKSPGLAERMRARASPSA